MKSPRSGGYWINTIEKDFSALFSIHVVSYPPDALKHVTVSTVYFLDFRCEILILLDSIDAWSSAGLSGHWSRRKRYLLWSGTLPDEGLRIDSSCGHNKSCAYSTGLVRYSDCKLSFHSYSSLCNLLSFVLLGCSVSLKLDRFVRAQLLHQHLLSSLIQFCLHHLFWFSSLVSGVLQLCRGTLLSCQHLLLYAALVPWTLWWLLIAFLFVAFPAILWALRLVHRTKVIELLTFHTFFSIRWTVFAFFVCLFVCSIPRVAFPDRFVYFWV